MLAALILPTLFGAAGTYDLYRGAPIATPHYWDVEDTYIDSGEPDKGNGGSYTLLGGKGRTILIRFGDLNRIVGPNKHVTRATLYLTPSGPVAPVLHSVGRLLESWGQGPRTALSSLFTPPPAPGTKTPPARWQADYRQRKAGIASWHMPGALGAEDQEPVKAAHMDATDREVAIGGVEAAVQQMLDHPNANNGFALEFDSAAEFSSSKASTGRPRLEIVTEERHHAESADLSVISITSDPAEPKGGQDVTYTATVKNVGTGPAQGFSGAWWAKEKPATTFDYKDALAPGATATFTYQKRFDPSPTDHRVDPIEVRIVPGGPDACSTNDALCILENARPVSVTIPPALVASFSSANYLGSTSWEDWVQAQVNLWNDTVAAQSEFSFAPEGALERIRVNTLAVGGASGVAVPADASPSAASIPFLKSLGLAIGMLDGSVFNIPSSKVQIAGSTARSCKDLYPGIMGYGDTRFDGGIIGGIPLPFVPAYAKDLVGSYLEITDLLCANDVAGLNAHLSTPSTKPSDYLLPISRANILRALDYQGTPLANTDLLFFQSSGGSIPAGDPVFAIKTNDVGVAIINSRGDGGPFGELTPTADNGLFLIQAKLNGVLETGWLSAWQLNEENLRHAITESLYLNLPGAQLDRTEDLAPDRLIADSTQDLPAKLAPLIDDDDSTSATLPGDPGSWVEIDLGRDRFVGEVDLVTDGKPFWQQFDIGVYGTGQRPAEGSLFARELNWPWSSTVRRDASKTAGVYNVAYRGYPERVRYIRITNKSGGTGSLREIRVFAAKLGQ
jgi:hypothetical protein